MKKNVSVVRFKFRCNILISSKIIKELPGLVGRATPYIFVPKIFIKFIFSALYKVTKNVFFMHVSTLQYGHLLWLDRYLNVDTLYNGSK
jgi:hypothetical protein